jgi:dTDP-4-dehydrorhamnose reductase
VRAERDAARTRRRVLLLGARGRLGGAIATRAATLGGEWVTPPRATLALDANNPYGCVERWFENWRPDTVVNCIALGDVDLCEAEPALARQVNTSLPAALARACAHSGARLIHFSTDFVFDGTLRRPYREDDTPCPLSVYGESKLAGEHEIADTACQHWIFRVSWLYGAPARNLAADLLDPSNAGRVIRLPTDRFGVPNPVQLLAAEVAHCIARDRAGSDQAPASGVYHLSCHGATTWHAFGLAFVREATRAGRLAADRVPRIEGIEEASLGRAARRPAWSALDPTRYERNFERSLPSWEAAIPLALELPSVGPA